MENIDLPNSRVAGPIKGSEQSLWLVLNKFSLTDIEYLLCAGTAWSSRESAEKSGLTREQVREQLVSNRIRDGLNGLRSQPI